MRLNGESYEKANIKICIGIPKFSYRCATAHKKKQYKLEHIYLYLLTPIPPATTLYFQFEFISSDIGLYLFLISILTVYYYSFCVVYTFCCYVALRVRVAATAVGALTAISYTS